MGETGSPRLKQKHFDLRCGTSEMAGSEMDWDSSSELFLVETGLPAVADCRFDSQHIQAKSLVRRSCGSSSTKDTDRMVRPGS